MGLEGNVLDPALRRQYSPSVRNTGFGNESLQNPSALSSGESSGRQNSGTSGGVSADSKQKEPMEYVAAPGHGSGCGHCTGQAQMVPKGKAKEAKEARNKKIYDDVWAHELAHAGAAKGLGGSPSIKQDPETGAASGSVPIKVPGVNKQNPDKSVDDAQTIMAAAMAPRDPSSQDFSVAATGRSLMGEAQQMKAEKLSKEGNGKGQSESPLSQMG